jgi:4'-phosphopantetheinyl transferase
MTKNHKIRNPSSEFRNQTTIYPVILSVPEEVHHFKPKDRVKFLSQHARQALALSSEKSGISLGKLNQDEKGAPLPSDGNCWSISHKTQYVGGVVSPTPIGIDIERIRSCSEGIFRKTATENEWILADSAENSLKVFFRYWTSKEAVLKALGTGIKDLLKCRIVQIIDNSHLNIRYANRLWLVEHKYFDHHIATIVKNSFHIDWTING